MAAAALDAPAFTVRDLVAELRWPEQIDVGLVEGAGGPRSPIAADGDNVSLAGAVGPHPVLPGRGARLGAVQAGATAVDALRAPPRSSSTARTNAMRSIGRIVTGSSLRTASTLPWGRMRQLSGSFHSRSASFHPTLIASRADFGGAGRPRGRGRAYHRRPRHG